MQSVKGANQTRGRVVHANSPRLFGSHLANVLRAQGIEILSQGPVQRPWNMPRLPIEDGEQPFALPKDDPTFEKQKKDKTSGARVDATPVGP